MMMQMLAAGGMPALTDGIRAADEDNPRGYFEFEAVKTTRTDSSWVASAIGAAVKMVTILLRDLPQGFDYRVILMQRDVDEVLRSQKAMLSRLGKTGARVSDDRLKGLFAKELMDTKEWLSRQPNFRFLSVDYRNCVRNPTDVARCVNEMLGNDFDISKMVEVVDASLYRKNLVAGL